MVSGYTPKQAARIKDQIDRDVAGLEDVARQMRNRVTDIGPAGYSVNGLCKSAREIAEGLKRVVDRRTH